MVDVPHPGHGEEVEAFVIRRAGSTVTEEKIVAWSKQNMAGHKYPRLIAFRQALPMTATAKILKRELAATQRD